MTAGVPYVQGGFGRREAMYFSVDPGHGPCRACSEHNRPPNPVERATAAGADNSLLARFFGANAGVGPAVRLLSALLAVEAMRYLTGFATPIARGIEWSFDLETGVQDTRAWEAWPDCEICAKAPAAQTRANQGRAARASARPPRPAQQQCRPVPLAADCPPSGSLTAGSLSKGDGLSQSALRKSFRLQYKFAESSAAIAFVGSPEQLPSASGNEQRITPSTQARPGNRR